MLEKLELILIMISISPKLFSEKNEAHIYLAYLPDMKEKLLEFWKILSAYEKARAEKIKNPLSKTRYIISHGILRKLLALYLNLLPEHIMYDLNPFGKPSVKNKNLNLQFNMSHSKDYIIYAFTLEHSIGVDIEWKKQWVIPRRVTHYVFSKSENEFYKKLNNLDKLSIFYKLWTYKESLLKASGQGLLYPLSSINIIACNRTFNLSCELNQERFYFYTPYNLEEYENTFSCSHVLNSFLKFRLKIEDF